MRSSEVFAAFALVLGLLPAQGVPRGNAIVSVTNNVAGSEGLWLVDRVGTASAVTGLVAAGSAGIGVNAVQIDPIDGRLWLAGINSGGNTAGQVNWARISGSTVTQFVQHATVPLVTPASIAAITFDDNADPIVATSTAVNGGGVFLVDRKNGGPAVLLGAVLSGTHNALCRDDAGNLYVGMSNGQVHVLVKNPDCSYQAPVQHGTVPVNTIAGIAFAPASGAHPDELWIATLGAPGANNLFKMPIAGGTGVSVNPAAPTLNWVEYDRLQGDLLVAPNSGVRSVDKVDRTTGTLTTIAVPGGIGAGVTSAIDVHDAADAQVVLAPMCLNGATGPFDLEIAVTCPPGSIAIVGATPSIILGYGVAGADGRFAMTIPNITVPLPFPPGALAFLAACLDVPTGVVNIGPPLNWPLN